MVHTLWGLISTYTIITWTRTKAKTKSNFSYISRTKTNKFLLPGLKLEKVYINLLG